MKVALTNLATVGEPVKAQAGRLKEEFRKELEARLDGWLGKPGTERRAKIEEKVSALLSEPDVEGRRRFEIEKLGEDKMNELVKLQRASQDFEAIFVKGLLAQMRRSGFAEESTPMGDMAKDMMDQAVSESVSRSKGSIGIAKTIFIDMAQRIARAADVKDLNGPEQ